MIRRAVFGIMTVLMCIQALQLSSLPTIALLAPNQRFTTIQEMRRIAQPIFARGLCSTSQEPRTNRIVGVPVLSADGKRILTVIRFHRFGTGVPLDDGSPSEVWSWDTESGSKVRVLPNIDNDVHSIALSPDGSQILTFETGFRTHNRDSTVRLWDAGTGTEIQQLSLKRCETHEVKPSPDGDYALISANLFERYPLTDTTLLWNTRTGEKVRWFDGAILPRFSPDGKSIIALSSVPGFTGIVKWNAATGNVTWKRKLDGYSSILFQSEKFVFCQIESTHNYKSQHIGHILDAATGEEVRTMAIPREWFFGADFSPDGQAIWTYSDRYVKDSHGVVYHYEARRINIVSGKTERTIEMARPPSIRYPTSSFQLLPNGRQALVSWSDGSMCLNDLTTGKIIRRFTNSEINAAP